MMYTCSVPTADTTLMKEYQTFVTFVRSVTSVILLSIGI